MIFFIYLVNWGEDGQVYHIIINRTTKLTIYTVETNLSRKSSLLKTVDKGYTDQESIISVMDFAGGYVSK